MKNERRRAKLAFCAALVASLALPTAVSAADEPPNQTLFTNVNVSDDTSESLAKADVLVEGHVSVLTVVATLGVVLSMPIAGSAAEANGFEDQMSAMEWRHIGPFDGCQ